MRGLGADTVWELSRAEGPVPCPERAVRTNISIQSATSKIVGMGFPLIPKYFKSDLLRICINHGGILMGEFHLVKILIGITNSCVNKGRILTVGGPSPVPVIPHCFNNVVLMK